MDLVYINDEFNRADVVNSTRFAKVDRNISVATLYTAEDGTAYVFPPSRKVRAEDIVSDRPVKTIAPPVMYYSLNVGENTANFNQLDNADASLKAKYFVKKNNLENPLENTSRSALGSGIYGFYIDDVTELELIDNQLYKIDLVAPYVLQDKEHGQSLTIASLHTNRYLDKIIQDLRFSRNSGKDVIGDINNLLNLWNIVFRRTDHEIDEATLRTILINYVDNYLQSDALRNDGVVRGFALRDSINGEAIQQLPINDIMATFGFDGLIADDEYNNGWDRGCISYNYEIAGIIQGDVARF